MDDIYNASPRLPPKDGAGAAAPGGAAAAAAAQAGKPSKWQPLSTVEPSPIGENDPFSLGDSDEEGVTSTGGAAKDGGKKDGGIKMDDNERLKKAAAEAMADSLVDPPKGESAAKK